MIVTSSTVDRDHWGRREELAAFWLHILAYACCCNWLATPHLPPLPMWC